MNINKRKDLFVLITLKFSLIHFYLQRVFPGMNLYKGEKIFN